MTLPQRRWQQIEPLFTEEEKLAIHKAVIGHPAMQQGDIIDEGQLAPYLREKLRLNFLPQAVEFPARLARAAS